LGVTTFHGYIRKPFARGGGLAQVGSKLLLATGDGSLYTVVLDSANDRIETKQLPYYVPMNATAFANAVGGTYEEPTYWETAKKSSSVQTWRFRVAGIYAQENGSRLRLFASHHYWNSGERCYVVRVSMLEADTEQFFGGMSLPQWQTIFESSPCMRLDVEQEVTSNPFVGEEIGGRMALLDPDTLLLTLGGMGYDGVDFKLQVSQDPAYTYGKTILIDLRNQTSRIFTSGHRNPQGLYVDANRNIWSTEHGPQGGDELNLLRDGRDYGWPTVTYGTDYGTMVWPNNPHQGDHDGFELPIFAWVPSIGISALAEIARDRFAYWQGDLLIGSLGAHSLFRTRIRQGRAVLVEPIYIGQRIRDIVEASDGQLVLWTDDADLISIAPATTRDAPTLFSAECGGCHTAIRGARHGIGPNLWGVYDARIGANESYDEYSRAMHDAGGSWNEARLDRFLAGPSKEIPGTRMRFAGLSDASDRKLIIDYLETLTE
jgi:aldose sugar dehydrogenase